ncbi:MAG: hypothetical protein ABSG26_05135 [Bryobacteraceae bacterium]|jgi:hypothetical protein
MRLESLGARRTAAPGIEFSFVSSEYRGVPLYGWLPNALRYRLRVAVHAPDIMKLGIDFNQFTYFGLRRVFK